MKKLSRILFAISVVILSSSVKSQNYIGLHKDEIREKVKEELSGFAYTKEVFNNDRSFIKFESNFEEQTLIFVLNSEGFCTSVSRMYNTWLFNRIKSELASKYGKGNNQKWEEIKDGKYFEIELIKGDWFITVITRSKKN